jgi:plasmid stabilization system protein ParE
MYQVIMKSGAIKMAKEAYEWYDEQQPGLGITFLRELRDCRDNLESRPEAYQKIKKNYRQLVLHTFPYVIVFEIIKNEVVVYAVFHTSRNPKKKFSRK